MRVFGRIAVVVLLIALIGAVGYGVWNAGYDQGVVDAAESTTEIVVTQQRGGFFPFGAIFGLFFLFLLFGLLFKFAFGWRRWGHYKSMGPGGYREHMERRMNEWHDEAHGRAPPSEPAGQTEGPIS